MITKLLLLASILCLTCSIAFAEYSGTAQIGKGKAQIQTKNLFSCENGRSRVSPIGIQTINGKEFIVPAEVQYETKNFASDLYNECSNIEPQSLAEVDLSSVPIVEIDKDGEVITGFIFADNYFELYINGKLVGVDSVPFTPFNSNVVKFKVKKPYEIAIKVVDWEENSGLGSENNRGKQFHPGDGGLIASFSDGITTNSNWKAQTFYTSPIYDLSCVEEKGNQRITKDCDVNGSDKYEETYSLHWDIPLDWQSNDIYKSWPNAVEYTEDEIGVNNKKAYMNFQEQFTGTGASFIWSSNLVLDNLILFRYQVK
jgi:hypothetical protein